MSETKSKFRDWVKRIKNEGLTSEELDKVVNSNGARILKNPEFLILEALKKKKVK